MFLVLARACGDNKAFLRIGNLSAGGREVSLKFTGRGEPAGRWTGAVSEEVAREGFWGIKPILLKGALMDLFMEFNLL